MGLFENNFPYTNFHELNIDWLLNTVKQILEKLNNLEGFYPIYCGVYDSSKTYKPLNAVDYNGSIYIATNNVPKGVTPDNDDYWVKSELPYFEQIAQVAMLNILIPDFFEGTDGEKLQSAIDSLENGGLLLINRDYQLDRNITFTRRNLATDSHIYICSISKNNRIYCNDFYFQGSGSTDTNHDVGGIFFDKIQFIGNQNAVCFEGDALINVYFNQCHFTGFTSAFYCIDGNYMQSYYFNQCYFNRMLRQAVNCYDVYDIRFNECTFEGQNSALHFRHKIETLAIQNCLINGLKTPGIVLAPTTEQAEISGCYFESNVSSIMLTNVTSGGNITIDRCMFVLFNEEIGIQMPKNLFDGTLELTISNCANDGGGANVLSFAADTYNLKRLNFFGNSFPVYQGSNPLQTMKFGVPRACKPVIVKTNYTVGVIMDEKGYFSSQFFMPTLPEDIQYLTLASVTLSNGGTVSNPNDKWSIGRDNDNACRLVPKANGGDSTVAGKSLTIIILVQK